MGLDYSWHRYYDYELGRFTQVDPLWQKYPSLSPYNYCANNPLTRIDPDGKQGIAIYAVKERITQNISSIQVPLVLDVVSLGANGMGHPWVAFGLSTGAVVLELTDGNMQNAAVGATTDIIGLTVKSPKNGVWVAVFQVVYDLTQLDPSGDEDNGNEASEDKNDQSNFEQYRFENHPRD